MCEDNTDGITTARAKAGWFGLAGAAALGIAVTWISNIFFVTFIGRMLFEDDALHDSAVAVFTLMAPGFLGGLAAGFAAPRSGMTAGILTGATMCLMAFVKPFWHTTPVTQNAAHSGLVHYFTLNPLTLLAFAALGGWLAGQFGTGRFTLADAEPVRPDESD